ncbi:MAG: helix-turn-helix transcriptional regulator [Phenylobacterium sp.]|uniref:helix-turn-helix domain-containing protein n=1 Tax=Phenylobacterium sp. TaxID=1871053 RepID=UPI002723029A|nr:helix-turn-helix transcriptional regulator [Phenylobacterium sp.]MDO8409438.1 helix-turn-helix transcriptional regulator [Phenylobacterium sp.]
MTKDLDLDRSPNPVDRHVGLRIRLRRKELGVSQEKLADSIGLTFQQVQKYERAANRVSASKLWEVARALKTSIAYFYEGLGDPAEQPNGAEDGRDTVHDFLLTPEGMELATLFPRIRRARVRRRLLDLVRTMAEEAEADLDEAARVEEV